jgi:hypothetical protein
LVYLSEIDFLWMVLEEVPDVLFPDAVNVLTFSAMTLCALKPLLRPAVGDP